MDRMLKDEEAKILRDDWKAAMADSRFRFPRFESFARKFGRDSWEW